MTVRRDRLRALILLVCVLAVGAAALNTTVGALVLAGVLGVLVLVGVVRWLTAPEAEDDGSSDPPPN